MFTTFGYKELKPAGWMRRQLEIQAEGLSGHLDLVWPDVRDSAWVGGKREGWERVPYWIDGFIPLAYLLDREDLIARAERYLNCIFQRQQADGWICPCSVRERESYDVWAYYLVCKVLTLYIELTGSQRAEKALYSAMKCLWREMKSGRVKLFGWGEYRWFEAFIPLLHLKDKYNERWIKELGQMIRDQGARYAAFADLWKEPVAHWRLTTHIVNLSMFFKYEALTCAFFDERPTGEAEELWKILEAYNGTAVGTFTGDECLSGLGNNRGTELCAVAELMYACETIYRLTGEGRWLSRLEKAAFNAFPATVSDDMWTHQYVQQVNQIACERFPGGSFFRTNSSESHLFGLEPNYGCCTANFNQAWPKLALFSALKTEEGVQIPVLLPFELETVIRGANVRIALETDYPFRHSAKLTVKSDRPVDLSVAVKIPAFAKELTVNGVKTEKRETLVFDGPFEGKSEFSIGFTDEPRLVRRPHDLYTVEYGPLVFALPLEAKYRMLEYEVAGVVRKYPYCDYELSSEDEWRYGFADLRFIPEELPGDGIPFSSKAPRVVLHAKLARVAWEHADGFETVANETPASDKALFPPEDKTLYPYGCAKLRMTEMPLTK